jgi:hypothetical protein
MTEITLNDEQAKAILIESLQRGLYESPGNVPPPEPERRMQDALQLVAAARNAAKSGNKSENVMALLFLAEVDQQPPAAPIPQPEPVQQATNDSGIDLTTVSDAILENLITGLDKYVATPPVEQQRAAFLAEKERRANAKAMEEVPQVQESQATNEQALQENGNENMPAGETAGEETGENASAFARVQTPETSPEGKKAKAKPIEEDGERTEVINQLNLSILENYGVKFVEVEKIDTDKLNFMIANPDGPPAEVNKEDEMIETKLSKIGGKEAIAGMDMGAQAPVQLVTKADVGLDSSDSTEMNSSSDRETLESLLTGPTLKAYRRGRKEVPSIGDNELRLMITNPTGKISLEQLNAAKAADGNAGKEVIPPDQLVQALTPEIQKVVAQPQPQAALDPQQMLLEAQQAAEKEAQSQVIETPVEDRTIAQAAHEAVAQREPKNVSKAMEIISKENLPIPDEIGGEPPRLPNDVSKCSRDEIYSLHARFHACEVRTNWLISEEEDKLGDITKLKTGRAVEVYSSIPSMIDGVKTTNDYRDKSTAADSQVIEFGNKEFAFMKIIKKLKGLRDNYHLDCERLSRQMSKWEKEYQDNPR